MPRLSLSRRSFLGKCGASGAAALTIPAHAGDAPSQVRSYHLSISPESLRADPELLDLAHHAGVTDVWLTGFLYGHWLSPLEESFPHWRRTIERRGMSAHLINVPLGHPGDSLGAKSGNVPLTPPEHWRLAVRPDGTTYAGTSLHPPSTEENCAAIRRIQAAGVNRVFLDDDFRLARGPGVIGGCFCPEHKREFLREAAFGEAAWQDLVAALARRELTPHPASVGRVQCDQLTACFLAQKRLAPGVQLGIMVMYLGSEKAGIRLDGLSRRPVPCGRVHVQRPILRTGQGKDGRAVQLASFTADSPAPNWPSAKRPPFPQSALGQEHGREAGRLDAQRRPQHDVHERATPFPGNTGRPSRRR